MDDLLKSQIKDSCQLALPDGLKELMSDISREVLRAQPNDLYSFIADYLSVLLVTRENMSVVTRVCDDACAGCCLPELEDELRFIGLDEEGAASAMDIIVEYFNRDQDTINEGNLIMKLMKKTSLDIDLLPQVQTAVRNAFLRHQANRTIIYQSSSESDKDEAELAASHTIQLYRKTKPIDEDLNQKAARVQAAYRAYGVRRHRGKRQKQTQKLSKTLETTRKNISFDPSAKLDEPRVSSTNNEIHKCSVNTVSSISLAGSLLQLPKHVPYCVHDPNNYLSDLEENPEKEHTIDYTVEKLRKVTDLSAERQTSEEYKTEVGSEGFNNKIEDEATGADIESEESVHEYINEEFHESESEGNDLTN